MSNSPKAASVTSIQPQIKDLDRSINSSDKHKIMTSASKAQTEMAQVGKNTENTNIVSNRGKDSYSSTKDSNTPSKSKRSSSAKSGGRRPKKTRVESFDNSCGCENRPMDENIMDQIPFYKKCHHKFCCKIFVFLIIGILNIADLISDWLLYRDVAMTENGLVYGQVEDSLQYSLLAFSIIGSITFTFEVVNLWWEIFRNNPWVDSDLSSAITIWIEDVPQISINVAIVACREEAISYFQLVKASVIILGAVIRIAVSLFKYCSKKALHDLECAKQNKESMRHVVYRAFIMLGLILTLGGAVAVFMFTQSERNPDGSINFKVPHSVVDGEFDDEKYFQNVSIYFSHKLVDFNNPPIDKDHINLINLVHLNDIRKKDYDVIVNVAYDDITAAQTKVVVVQTDTTQTTKKQDCFEIDRTSSKLTKGTNCDSYITGPKSEIIFTFHFIKAKVPDLIFGDVTYNVKEKIGGTCSDATFTIQDNVEKRLNNLADAAMHYFRTENVDGQFPIIHLVGTDGRFYQSSDLIDVKDLWRTGYATCKSSGSVAPHFDENIHVTC